MRRFLFAMVLAVSLFATALPSVFAAGPGELLLPPELMERDEGGRLPTANFKTEIIPQAIKIVLALMATLSFGIFVYAGVMLVISQGNEEEITKFKNIIIWSAAGMAFITTAYAIVSGVMQLVFK